MGAKPWKVDDRCRLVDMRNGRVLDGVIARLDGAVAIVRTAEGLFRARVDSSFLQRPTPADVDPPLP